MLKVGFPYDTFPTGWFQVAWDRELVVGTVLSRHYFGRDLVIYRADDDVVRVADAVCRHMGANIACGGWTEGDDIVCPFHGWQFDGEGRNTRIPYSTGPNGKRRIRQFPTRVSNGIVWMWHDELDRDPWWEPPIDRQNFLDGSTYPVYPDATHRWENEPFPAQLPVENQADMEHIRFVHKGDGPIELLFLEPDGHMLRSGVKMTFGYGKPKTWLTPDGPIEAGIKGEAYGIGIIMDLFSGTDETWLFDCHTPVTHTSCDLFNTYLIRKPEDEPEGEFGPLAQARMREQIKQVGRDLVIWRNMHYVQNPATTREEGKFMATLRRWCATFYPSRSDVEAHRASTIRTVD